MNSVALVGRLTREPEVRYGGKDSSVAIARFTLAVQDRDNADFITIKALGKLGEWAEKWLSKGSKVELTGKIKTGHYKNREGNEVYYTEVLANHLEFGESKAEADARKETAGSSTEKKDEDPFAFMNIPVGIEEDLPFN